MTLLLKSSLPEKCLSQGLFYSWFAWVFVLPFSAGLSNVFLALGSILAVAHFFMGKLEKLGKLPSAPGMVLFGLLFLSTLWSQDQSNAWSMVKNWLPVALSSFFCMSVFSLNEDNAFKGFKILGISCLLAGVFTLLANVLPEFVTKALITSSGNLLKPFPESNRQLFGWYVPFMERINFANLLSYSGMTVFFIGLALRDRRWAVLAFALFALVAFLGARASFLGLLLILPVLLRSYMQSMGWQMSGKQIAMVVLTAAILVVLLFPVVQKRVQQTKFELETISDGSYTQYEFDHFTTLRRMISWSNAYELWSANMVLGTGIGDYKTAFEATYANDTIRVSINNHSQWLFFLGVFGLIGTILFLSALIYWFWRHSPAAIARNYAITFSLYTALIWLLDAVVLRQVEMMSFGLFTTFILCLSERHMSRT